MKRSPLIRKTPLQRGTSLLKRSRLRRVSRKHASRLTEYSRIRKVYIDSHPYCEVCCERQTTDIHHTAKRGRYLTDWNTFLAVCRPCHTRIHDNPRWAREQGYLK